MESRHSSSMTRNSGNIEDSHHLRETTDDSESNMSFNSNNDDEPILTATITFDVTVDPSGQVISTSEGQIISESFQNPHDGRTISLSSHQRPFDQLHDNQATIVSASAAPHSSSSNNNNNNNNIIVEERAAHPREAIQADSLTSLNSATNRAGGGGNRQDITLHDSLDEVETDEDTSSTSTESLIERSKKYMNQEAGIIILKRDNLTSQNFNINLDFDLKNENSSNPSGSGGGGAGSGGQQAESQENDPGKSFNINLDFDIHSNRDGLSGDESSSMVNNPDGTKGFNINLDFDIKDGNVLVPRRSIQDVKKTGVGIDLMITSNSTVDKLQQQQQQQQQHLEEKTINEMNQEMMSHVNNNNNNNNQSSNINDAYDDTYLSSTVTYHYIEDSHNLNDSLNNKDNTNLNEPSRLYTNEGGTNMITTESKDINLNSLDLINQYERLMDQQHHHQHHHQQQQQQQNRSTLQEDTARLELINRMVKKSLQKESAIEKDNFYAKNIPKLNQFSLEDCLDQVLEDGNNQQKSTLQSATTAGGASNLPVLRSFETVDFEALTKGFDPEEVKEGKLVLYITEAQLLQLLKQRAIIVPDKTKLFQDTARDTSRTSRVSLVDEKIQDKLGRESPVNTVELVVDREIQNDDPNNSMMQDDYSQQTDNTYNNNNNNSNNNNRPDSCTGCYTPQPRQSVCDTPQPRQSVCDTPQTRQSVCETPQPRQSVCQTPQQPQLDYLLQQQQQHQQQQQQSESSCVTPAPPSRLSQPNLVQNMAPPSSSLTTQSIGEDCRRLLTFDQSERALSIIREYIDKTARDEDNCLQDLPRKSSSLAARTCTTAGTDEPHQSPRVFNAFLNKIFDENLKNKLIRDSAFEKGLDLLTELVDHVVDEAQIERPIRDSYVEKGKVFESFTDYVHKNIPTYTEKTKQIANDQQLNQIVRELADFYNEAVDCNGGRRRSSVESHADKVLKILGDFVDKELDEDFNGRLFTDEQSDMAITIIRDYMLETIDECYHKGPVTYDRIDGYIDNLIQTRNSIDRAVKSTEPPGSLSSKNFDRIDTVIDSILQNRLSNLTEKSFDRSDNSNSNILQSRISISNDNNDNSRYSNVTQKSVDGRRSSKNYDRIDNAVDAVLQNRLSVCSVQKLNNTNASIQQRHLIQSACSQRGHSRLLTDKQSDRAMSLLKDYITQTLNECNQVNLDDTQTSIYERNTSFLTDKSSNDSVLQQQHQQHNNNNNSTNTLNTTRIFDSFLNSIFDDNLKNSLKRNNSYQKGLELLTEFVDNVLNQVKSDNQSSFDSFLQKGKLFDSFSEFVNKNIHEFKPNELNRTLVFPTCVDDNIKKALKGITDFYDEALEKNGVKSPDNTESQEEKVVKILGDFVERISNHFFNNNNNKSNVTIEDERDRSAVFSSTLTSTNPQNDMAPKVFDTFLNKIFDDNLKDKLVAENSFDKSLSVLTDLIDYVTTNVKSINPSYDTFLENGKLFERFPDYVNKNISVAGTTGPDVSIERDDNFSSNVCVEEKLKRVTLALSNFYDNALDCNGKRRPTVETKAEKIQKILGDFVDRISNHYYNDPMISIEERSYQQIDSTLLSDNKARLAEPSVDTLKKIDDFIDHVLEKRRYKVEKGNEGHLVQAVSAASVLATTTKKPEKLAVSVVHQNISAKRSPDTYYINETEKTYKNIDQISRPLTIDAYQPALNKIATAYDGVKLISPTVAQLNDGKLLKYKDFDLMVPSDYHYRDSASSDSKSHLDYIVAGSDGTDYGTNKTQVNFPKSYEFLNRGLDYVEKTEEDALSELDKFFQQLVSNLDNETQRINWPVINKFYSTKDQREKADIIKKFISGLATEVKPEMISGIIIEDKGNSLPDKTGQTLKILDNFVDHALDKKPITHKITDREAINLISDLIHRLRDFLKNWKPVKNPELKKLLQGNLDNKIIIKTTKKLPAKISVSGNNKQQQFVKKKITYSYLDNYNPTTRVYELADTEMLDMTGAHAIDLFNSSKDLNYLLKPFDPAIADSIGKPSLEQINKYLSVINTGVKNTDLIQIHPLLNSQTTIKNQSKPNTPADNNPKLTEPVIIDSANYHKYIDDVSKHFNGLQITDFPLYVQGLEFKQSDGGDDKMPQTYIKTNKDPNQQQAHTGTENNGGGGINLLEPTNLYTKQVANNSGNIQYVRVKSSNQIIVAK